MGYLPEGYSIPKSPSDYMKFEEGQNKFRILGNVKIGWEYFNTENKPIRMKNKPIQEPQDLGFGQYGKNEVKHFWAFKVFNFRTQKVELLSITQLGILRELESLFCNEEWGSPKDYNITVSKSGKGKETRYSVQPSPHSNLTPDILQKINSIDIDFEQWMRGGKNVFIKKQITEELPTIQIDEYDPIAEGMQTFEEEEEIKVEEVPFN